MAPETRRGAAGAAVSGVVEYVVTVRGWHSGYFGLAGGILLLKPALLLAYTAYIFAMNGYFLLFLTDAIFYAFVVIFGLAYSAPLVLFPVVTGQLFGMRQFVTIDATLCVAATVIGASGGVISGWVADVTGSFAFGFLLSAVLLAAVIPVQGWAVVRRRPVIEGHFGEGGAKVPAP
ncbi:hypothetical protein [Zavarzinia compransoris]|uniref:Major facilitator superfamily (MFS) profile domain-containing protein n=1 Tax=Zavarzinia compransoris TaxID=1264899 RepID=A0A317DZG2_9PROT|nr:hypothetical protein [Zavarzinia compransoris]PWR18275.1 hypothetical protein DKG75_20100 [Zavarzinia compransoris]TDP43669.1 hypothetical protein DES42_11096 [Zavarzinia compransoris]